MLILPLISGYLVAIVPLIVMSFVIRFVIRFFKY